MQVAFGIATNKYSLPIPSTCPEEFTQLMKSNSSPYSHHQNKTFSFEGCWRLSPEDRPNFKELLTQIDEIVPKDYNPVEFHEESYQSLQDDWRQEIQDMFEELKEKEQVR